MINWSFLLSLHYLFDSWSYFTLLFGKFVFNHSWNWAFNISIRHVSDLCCVLIDSLQNIPTNYNLSTNNFFLLWTWVIARLWTQVHFVFWFNCSVSNRNKVSVWHWPWSAVSHVCDFEVSSLLEENFIFNTCWVEFFKNTCLDEEFVDFFNCKVDNSDTFWCNISFKFNFRHFTWFIRIFLPILISFEFFKFDNNLFSNFLKLLDSRFWLIFHVMFIGYKKIY